jgi:drug/metabolite transporter (DMT)-like permease
MSDNLRGAAWMLASCAAATAMMIGVRAASGTLHPLQIVFCRFLVGFLLVLPFITMLLAVVGVFAAGRVYFDIRGYAAGEAGFVAPFGYFRIILVGAAGYLLFAEIPTANALIGAAMIIVSTLFIAQREARWGRAGAQM